MAEKERLYTLDEAAEMLHLSKVSLQLYRKRYGIGCIKPAHRIPKDKQVKLTITFYHGDKKRRDSDNQLSSILDLLVDAGILADDNWQIIPQKEIFDVFDKDNARAVISIAVGEV